MELRVFKCQIDEELESELEVSFVALVGKPAIERNFLKFNADDMNEADVNFLKNMIPHHTSAIKMANEVLRSGINKDVKKLAENIIAAQDSEIELMTSLLPSNTVPGVAMRSHFSIDEDKRIISGPAMLADFPIYRKDDQFGEYYVTFDKETIYSIVKKFCKKGLFQNFNLSHKEDQQLTSVTMFESFIVDSERGVAPIKGFEDAKDGSWFISATIDNDDLWQRIKAEEFKGFSVEGIFQYIKMDVKLEEVPKNTPEQALEKILQILSETEAIE